MANCSTFNSISYKILLSNIAAVKRSLRKRVLKSPIWLVVLSILSNGQLRDIGPIVDFNDIVYMVHLRRLSLQLFRRRLSDSLTAF
jgi:hypothetical protein